MKDFDKYIKNRLQDHEMPVDDGIWQAIESRLTPRRNNRLWFFLLIPLLFAPALLLVNSLTEETTAENSRDINLALLESRLTKQPISTEQNPALDVNPTKQLKAFESEDIQTDPSESILQNRNSNVIQKTTLPENFRARLNQVNSEKNDVSRLNLLNSAPQITSVINDQLSTNRLENSYKKKAAHRLNNQTGTDCPIFKAYNPGFYLYGQYTAEKPYQRLTAKSAEFAEYAFDRRMSETPSYSYSATLGVGYQFDNGIVAESGLAYDRINVDFKFIDSTTTTVITIDTIDNKITRDTSFVHEEGPNTVRAKNRFTQIDIPVVIGFEFPLGEKLRLSLKGGVLINLSSSNNGYMLGLDGKPLAFGSGSGTDNDYFKRNIGFSYTGGLNIETDVTDNFSIYAGANYRYYPNKFNLPGNHINQSYSKLGFRTGIKYRL